MEPETLQRLLQTMLGESLATRYVISVLIASHPRPDALHDTWHQSKAEWIDGIEAQNHFRSPAFLQAALQRMSALSQEIDEQELLTRPPRT